MPGGEVQSISGGVRYTWAHMTLLLAEPELLCEKFGWFVAIDRCIRVPRQLHASFAKR
jgi:hypothetical protein